jgi:hypothetical protein
MRVHRVVAVVICAGALLAGAARSFASSADADRLYTFRLDQVTRAGDKEHFELTRVQNSHWQTFEQGASLESHDYLNGAKIIADAEVLDVKDGLARKIAYSVDALLSYDGRDETTLLSNGAKVIAEADEYTTKFEVNGKPASKKVLSALQQLSDLAHHVPADYRDRAFGPGRPRRVGDRWSPNLSVIAEQLKSFDPTIQPGDMQGSCLFAGVEDVDGEPCLVIDVDVSASPHKMPTTEPVEHYGQQYVYETIELDSHLKLYQSIDPTHGLRKASGSSVRRYTGQFGRGKRTFTQTFRDMWEGQSKPLAEGSVVQDSDGRQ